MNDDTQYAIDDIAVAATIASAIQDALSSCSVMVDVSHGDVTLVGEVETMQQRAEAEAIARRFCSRIKNAVRLQYPR